VRLSHVLDAADWLGAGDAHPPSRRRPLHPVRRQIAAVIRRTMMLGVFRTTDAEYTAQTEAYVCSDCGFLEEYVIGAAEIPWQDVDGATRLDAP